MENTLFVSTLPYAATSKDLETFCSEVGPLRSCFVVQDKTDPAKNAGCGFVTYVLAEDAAKAIPILKKKKFMDVRHLKIEFARKPNDRQAVASPQSDDKSHKKNEKEKKLSDPPLKPMHSMQSLLLSELPTCITQKQLYKKVKKYGTVSSIKYAEGTDNAIIDYNTSDEASNALKHLNDHVFKGTKIKAELRRKEKFRLFLKNLHFQCTEQDIRKVAKEFGDIKDVSVPAKNENRCKGFAFLEYSTKEECEKAILGLKGKKIRGREISVDYAVSKRDFIQSESVKDQVDDSMIDSSKPDSTDVPSLDLNDNLKAVDENLSENENASDFEDSDDNGESDEPVSGTSTDEKTASSDEKKRESKFMEDTTLFIRNLSYDVSQEDLQSAFGIFGKLRYARITMDSETGHSRGTGFICYFNEEDAKSCYNSYQEFINTSAVDEWKESQFLNNSGKKIVSSLTPEPANALVNSPFFLDGRLVNISWALSRSDAAQAAKDGKAKKRAEDKRNMYLMTEGVIFPDSDAAKGMSPSELSRRQKSYSERKRILALNPNLFMSKTRLSIRNLNLKVDDKLLQSAAQNAVSSFWQEVNDGKREGLESDVMEEATKAKYNPIGKKKVWVKQAKILRSNDRIDPSSKLGRSKGYGFVEFLHHCDALACLRWMNNNPTAFKLPEAQENDGKATNRLRPIVEFAVENKLVLKRRGERNGKKAVTGDKKRKRDEPNDVESPKKMKKDTRVNAKKGKDEKSNDMKKLGKKLGTSKIITKNSTNDRLAFKDKESKNRKQKKEVSSAKPPRATSGSKIMKSSKVIKGKNPQNKKSGGKIEKNGQKPAKKLINLNISIEDMKKWKA